MNRLKARRILRLPSGLGFGALLGMALLLLSYLRLAGLLRTAAFRDPKVVAETLAEPLWQTRLGLNIVLFACAQVLVHLSFGALCWVIARLSERAWPKVRATRRQWTFIWFLGGTAWLLVTNATHFPRSSLGTPYQAIGAIHLFGVPVAGVLGWLITAGAFATTLMALLRILGLRRLAIATGVGAVLFGATGFLVQPGARNVRDDQPNVILLGMDSLRPDMLNAENTPHMHAFMDGSLRLSDAVTPLARTFPSWVSILTGRHPHTTGAIMNLLPRESIHEGATLPALLRTHGYQTIYAIDETRFSNIDASYGFDTQATPGIGGSDFVLAWFADTPLSNIVTNTYLGALLFPFQHANRAAFVTYDPDSFVRRVDRALEPRRPVFLALHLTLPHWPFEWADSGLPANGDAVNATVARRWKYLNTVHRADRQFGAILEVLERKGLLKNAIVVALSDHGEGLGANDDFMFQALPGEEESTLEAQEFGHGTSVFSPHQYHTVLGFRAFGAAKALLPGPRSIDEPVSMIDIAPTILDLLHAPARESMDGESLLPLFRNDEGAAARFAGRVRFTESEYNPTGLDTSKMTASAIAAAAMAYRVNPRTDRLEVRSDMLGTIMSTRQYAALLDGAFAAAVPQESGGGPYRFVYRPRPGDAGPDEPVLLREALQERFGIEFSGEMTSIKP
jgi:arylsulfatase A-like enzyme